jgi:hypothetical protein
LAFASASKKPTDADQSVQEAGCGPLKAHAGRATSNHKKPVVVYLWMFLQNFPDAKEIIEPERAGFCASTAGD